MISTLIAIIYFILGVLFIICDLASLHIPAFILKSLLIPVLIIYLLVSFKGTKNKFLILLIAGLLFSWAGDVLLEYQWSSSSLFIPGLASFLLAHLMYIILFFASPGRNMSLLRFIFFIALLSLYGASLMSIISDDLGGMKIPVMVYAFIILTMLTGALNRINKVNRNSYVLTVTGAFLFVLSDSMLAINKFGHHFALSGVAVMSTYLAAQFLIVSGFLRESGKSL